VIGCLALPVLLRLCHPFVTGCLLSQTHYLICRTLKDVEKVLGENGFIRIHQSHLINPQYIRKLLRNDGGSIVMTDDTELGISRAKKDRLYELLAGMEKL